MGEWACPLNEKGAGRSLGAVEDWTQETSKETDVKELGSVETGGMRAKEWDLCEVSVGGPETGSGSTSGGEEVDVGTNGIVWRKVMSQRKRKEERRKVAAQLEQSKRESGWGSEGCQGR